MKLSKNKAENLIKAGAVDYLGERRELLKKLDSAAALEKLEKQLERATHFRDKNLQIYEEAKPASKKQADAYEKMQKYSNQIWDIKGKIETIQNATKEFDNSSGELEVLRFTFKDPFEGYKTELFQEPQENGKSITLGIVTKIKPWKQKNGKPMCFFSIRCPSGKSYDLVMFNHVYVPLELDKVYRMSLDGYKFKKLL